MVSPRPLRIRTPVQNSRIVMYLIIYCKFMTMKDPQENSMTHSKLRNSRLVAGEGQVQERGETSDAAAL
jgi:hypothetical protein